MNYKKSKTCFPVIFKVLLDGVLSLEFSKGVLLMWLMIRFDILLFRHGSKFVDFQALFLEVNNKQATQKSQ